MINNHLKIIHWNANDIKNKSIELLPSLNKENIDIAFISEIKLNPSAPLKMSNYIIYRTGNPIHLDTTTVNDGMVILLHRQIVHRQIKLNISFNINATTIKISSHSNTRITCISSTYKSPQNILDPNDLNVKNPLWIIRCVNPAGQVLYHHVQISDYVVIALIYLTHFLGHAGDRDRTYWMSLLSNSFTASLK